MSKSPLLGLCLLLTIALLPAACRIATRGPDAAVADTGLDLAGDLSARRDTGADSGSDGAKAADAGVDVGAPPSTFAPVGRAAETCPSGLGGLFCAGWPDATTEGPVWKYTTQQTWRGKTFERTYHVHLPVATPGKLPLVIVLHGGGLGGAQMLATGLWDDLGDPRGVKGVVWRKNTATCQSKPTTGLLPSYETAAGATCWPPALDYGNTLPFVSVFPDGVMDEFKAPALFNRHWEDGRVPSPGFDTDDENRDDVGFIDHLIAQLLADTTLSIDPAAIYVTGGSNGGMMTQRLACHFGDSRYPALSRVAAFHAVIGALPEGLYEGLFGRERCPKVARRPFPLQLVLGTDIDTPQCPAGVYPCSTPVVPGDGLMPFGVAGQRYAIYSPDSGTVLSGPDTIAFWQTAIAAAAGEAGTRVDDQLGYFTQRAKLTLTSSSARVEAYIVSGGGHMIGATRMDFPGVGGGWAFLSAFRRDASGTLSEVQPTWLTGTY